MGNLFKSSTFYERRLSAIFACTPRKTPAVRSWKNWHDNPQRLESSDYIGVSPPVGLLVIDLDSYKGVTTADVDKALGAPLPWDEAFLQSTPGGGQHYVFSVDPSRIRHIRNTSNTLGVPGFDIRCPDRGYIVTGRGYRVNGLFPSAPWALQHGRWPKLPEPAIRRLENGPNRAGKGRGIRTNITMCKPTLPYGIPNRCVPKDFGERNGCLLDLARWFLGKNPHAADAEIREVVAQWFTLAFDTIQTKDFDVSLREFTAAYRSAHTAMIPSLDSVFEGFRNDPIPQEIAAQLNATEQDVFRLTERLHKMRSGQSFHLSCRIAGQYIGKSNVIAAKALKRLRELGLLVVTKAAKFIKDGVSLATEYMLSKWGEKSCNVRAAATSLIHRAIGKTAHVLNHVIAPLVDVHNDDYSAEKSIRAGALPLLSRQN